MTTDIERELRELFRDKAGEAPVVTPATAPQRVLRRGRRRQVGTVLGSAAIALLVATGSFVGLRSILRDREPFRTAVPGYEVFERTVTIEAFTVTSPSDWFLVNEWPRSMQMTVGSGSASNACTVGPGAAPPVCTQSDQTTEQLDPPPSGLPMLQLSNIDTGLDAIACGDELPAGAAVLYVGLDYERAIAGVADPSIRPFPPHPGLPEQGTGPCGDGSYAHYTVHGEPFFTWVGLGSSVTDEDRATVLTAYEMMSLIPDWEPVPPTETTPAYVIAGGTAQTGDVWRLELRPSAENVELSLQGVEPGGSESDFTVPTVPIEWCCSFDGLTEVTFGAVSKGATGVELRPSDHSPSIPGTIAPLPPSLPFDFDVFFIDGTAGLLGEVVPLGLEGGTSPPPVAAPRGEVVDLSGTRLGQDWSVRFTGAFADGTACMQARIGDSDGEWCPRPLETSLAGDQPSLHRLSTEHLALLAGSVPPDVVELRFFDQDGRQQTIEAECRMGPLGWTAPDRKVCAIAFPPEGSGTLRYLDANGVTLFEEGMAWGSATAASNELPWTNEGTIITAVGSFQGTEWKLEVLHYLEGDRLTIGPDGGRRAFEGRLSEGEPVVIPLAGSEAGNRDAILLLLTDTEVQRVTVSSDETWEGRWLPGANAKGAEARIWLLELPGEGSAPLLIDDVEHGQVTWP